MISEDSRFNYTPRVRIVDNEGRLLENEHLDLPYARQLVVRSLRADVQDYTVREGDTWSNIAARFLRGRSDLWWVVAEFSGVVDPFVELAVGRVLRVPTMNTVVFDVLSFDMTPVSDAALAEEDVGG